MQAGVCIAMATTGLRPDIKTVRQVTSSLSLSFNEKSYNRGLTILIVLRNTELLRLNEILKSHCLNIADAAYAYQIVNLHLWLILDDISKLLSQKLDFHKH